MIAARPIQPVSIVDPRYWLSKMRRRGRRVPGPVPSHGECLMFVQNQA